MKRWFVFPVLVVLVIILITWFEFIAFRSQDDSVIIADNLKIPWSITFLPDSSALLTERQGSVRLLPGGEELLVIDEVHSVGEGGLLGVEAHPEFQFNNLVYFYYTYQEDGVTLNKVVRYVFKDDSFSNKTTIIDSIPGDVVHNGGRLRFGPDSKLYITAGDAGDSGLAQDVESLAGKILRLNDDGSIPADNPFNNSPVYSYGHRNPQGLAWDDEGGLWATEHGRTGTDELNLIKPGLNYGWPVILGDFNQSGMESPVIHSGADTWAPSGMDYHDGSLFFTGLRGQTLYEYVISEGLLRKHLTKEHGRLRTVVVGPDNYFYLLISNRDGRGVPSNNDDLVLRINPSLFS
ncbi:PQQ-dependent sugar dehydrogenase [archaeon]|nr:PQQ-dependent sugar dehydrogenase [archaeon]